MNRIPFWKMSGSGNDFILIDNRDGIVGVDDLPHFTERICRRKMSAGADGLILVEDSDVVDFKWRFLNSDGSNAEMCGNGARCVARFAFAHDIAGESMQFETVAGIISAQVRGDLVRIKMTAPTDLVLNQALDVDNRSIEFCSINTGVPHVVIRQADIDAAPVVSLGRSIRFHDRFAPAGTNVNFISALPEEVWAVRTYERGVEDETLACGTGNVAVALVLAALDITPSPVKLKTRSGGFLNVYFTKGPDGFQDVFLEGDARLIYQGSLHQDAWQYH